MPGQVASGTQLSLHQNCLLQDRPRGRVACLPRLLRMAKEGVSTTGDPWYREANPTTGKKRHAQKHWDPRQMQYPSVPSTHGCPGPEQVRSKPGRRERKVSPPCWTCSEKVRGRTQARGPLQLLRAPPSWRALAGAKACSLSWKDERPGGPGRVPRLAECLGTSGSGQVQGIKLTNGRAVCPGRRGIQAPTRRRLILAVSRPTERYEPGSRAGIWHHGHERVDSPRFPASRERTGVPAPHLGKPSAPTRRWRWQEASSPAIAQAGLPPKQGQDQAIPTLRNAFHPDWAGSVPEQTDKPKTQPNVSPRTTNAICQQGVKAANPNTPGPFSAEHKYTRQETLSRRRRGAASRPGLPAFSSQGLRRKGPRLSTPGSSPSTCSVPVAGRGAGDTVAPGSASGSSRL